MEVIILGFCCFFAGFVGRELLGHAIGFNNAIEKEKEERSDEGA